jgi:hypothetical protein
MDTGLGRQGQGWGWGGGGGVQRSGLGAGGWGHSGERVWEVGPEEGKAGVGMGWITKV